MFCLCKSFEIYLYNVIDHKAQVKFNFFHYSFYDVWVFWNFRIIITYYIEGFQLSAWLAELKYADTVPLEDLAATQLLEHLGLAKYVNSAQCNRMSTFYTPSANGWNSGIVVLEYFTSLKNWGAVVVMIVW